MSTVRYSAGFTRNMGDFESLRIDISVEDGKIGDETTDGAYRRVKEFVESRLLDEVAALEIEINNLRKQVRETGEYKRKVKRAVEKGK